MADAVIEAHSSMCNLESSIRYAAFEVMALRTYLPDSTSASSVRSIPIPALRQRVVSL